MKEGIVLYIINLFKILSTKGLVIIIGFLNSIIIARCLGVEGQGQYALAITIYSVGFQFVNMGLHSAHTYYLAKDKDKLSVVFGNSIGITCVSFVLCMIINYIFELGKFEVGLSYEAMCISFYLIPCYLYYYLQYQTLLVMDKILVLSVLDIIIVVINMLFFKEIEIGLYSAITIYIMGKILDILFEGIYFTKIMYIISDHYQEISQKIGEDVERGVTGLYGKGMYTEKEKMILLCVASRRQVIEVRGIVKKIDPKAFIVINNAREVFGKGFKE